MDGKKLWDVIGWFGAALVSMVLPVTLGLVTGSFEKVAAFASDPENGPDMVSSLVTWSVTFLLAGFAVGLAVRHIFALMKIKSLNGEIESLKMTKHAHEALFKEFCELRHEEQCQIVNVWLSEPGGLAPTDDQRKHMGGWVAMKRFVRHDPVTDRLHVMDGVGEMLLENPRHVYDLMSARVADLERKAEVRDDADAKAVNGKELDKLRAECARLKSESIKKDRRLSSLERQIADGKIEKTGAGTQSSQLDEEKYAILGTAGLADLLWAYDYIDEKGQIPSTAFGPKADSRRVQRLVEKGVLKRLGGVLSNGYSYDMQRDWALFVYRERPEIERRIGCLTTGKSTRRFSHNISQSYEPTFATITRAEAELLLDFFDHGILSPPLSDYSVRSLIDKGVIRVANRETKNPTPTDALTVCAEWTKLLNDHRDEFVKYFGLEPEK